MKPSDVQTLINNINTDFDEESRKKYYAELSKVTEAPDPTLEGDMQVIPELCFFGGAPSPVDAYCGHPAHAVRDLRMYKCLPFFDSVNNGTMMVCPECQYKPINSEDDNQDQMF